MYAQSNTNIQHVPCCLIKQKAFIAHRPKFYIVANFEIYTTLRATQHAYMFLICKCQSKVSAISKIPRSNYYLGTESERAARLTRSKSKVKNKAETESLDTRHLILKRMTPSKQEKKMEGPEMNDYGKWPI